MKEYKRTVNLLQVLNPSTFAKVNNEIYGGSGRTLGASNHAEKVLLAEDKFLKTILPMTVGISPSDAKWREVSTHYLYAFEVDVPKGGKNLDIGYFVNVADDTFKANIKALAKRLNIKIEKDDDLIKVLNGFDAKGVKYVNEMDFYMYCKPSDYLAYFTYIYCLHHNKVANNQSLINKSGNIEYYMVTEMDIKNEKRKRYSMEKALAKTMMKVENDTELANALYSVLNITAGDEIDKAIALNELSKRLPHKIMSAVNDKNIMLRAQIQEYIRKGLLKRMPNSSMIVDANDGTLIIGNNNDEAITFFSNAKNEAIISQFAARYKSL